MRAQRLQARGALRLLDPADLDPARLAGLMVDGLARPAQTCGVDLDGGPATARILEELAGPPR